MEDNSGAFYDREEFDNLMEESLADIEECNHSFWIEDPINVRLLRRFEKRASEGMNKYGTTMFDNEGDLEYWIVNAIEEQMDYLLYLERTLEEIQRNKQFKFEQVKGI